MLTLDYWDYKRDTYRLVRTEDGLYRIEYEGENGDWLLHYLTSDFVTIVREYIKLNPVSLQIG